MTRVAFADTNIGVITVGYATILRTTDAGVSWKLVTDNLNQGYGFSSVQFISPTDGYLATSSGLVYKSTNPGIKWNLIGSLPVNDIAEMAISGDSDLVVVGSAGMIMRSEKQVTTLVRRGTQ